MAISCENLKKGVLENYREKSGKFRVGAIKTVQIYECFFDLIQFVRIC
jgi:hypothetical protein